LATGSDEDGGTGGVVDGTDAIAAFGGASATGADAVGGAGVAVDGPAATTSPAGACVGVDVDPAETGSNGVGIGGDGDGGRNPAEEGVAACATGVEGRGADAGALATRGAFARRNSCPT
jgi:hypothetical protein